MHHSPTVTIQSHARHKRLTLLSPARVSLYLLILLSGLLAWPATVLAQSTQFQCYFENANGTPISAPPVQVVTFSPVTIPLPNNPAAGSNIGGPRSATASSGTIYISCPNGGTPGGLQPIYGTYNSSTNAIYSPTPGVAFQIQRSGTPIPLYPNGPLTAKTTQFTNNTTFQLISTGVLPSNGNQIPAGTTLGEWQFDNLCTTIERQNGSYYCTAAAATKTVIIFQSGGVTFTASTCSVSSGSQNMTVTLPPVATSALGAVGATAGTTRFGINLTGCRSNLGVSATLSPGTPSAGVNGVITSITGTNYATGVGIQILKSDALTPVTFNNAFSVGTTSGTNYTFDLYARYYQTATSVTPGMIQATATYTLTYQ